MKPWAIAARQPANRRLIAAAVIALWLGTFALLVLPQLHHLLHPDAAGPEHHCLVTQLQQHHLAGAPGSSSPLVVALLVSGQPAVAEAFLPSPADYRVSFSRGPPVLISFCLA